MRSRPGIFSALLAAATLAATFFAAAQEHSPNSPADSAAASAARGSAPSTLSVSSASSNATHAAPAGPVRTEASIRIEGERRFRANCGRCHLSPQKYSPRVMATIIRHMRVRATLTDEDMRYILAYMTQ
jgi:mono/diheme cytochrome c family protein